MGREAASARVVELRRIIDAAPRGRGFHGARIAHYLPMVRIFKQWRNITGVAGLHLNKAVRGPGGNVLRGPTGETLIPDVQFWYKGKLFVYEVVNTHPDATKEDRYIDILKHNGIRKNAMEYREE